MLSLNVLVSLIVGSCDAVLGGSSGATDRTHSRRRPLHASAAPHVSSPPAPLLPSTAASSTMHSALSAATTSVPAPRPVLPPTRPYGLSLAATASGNISAPQTASPRRRRPQPQASSNATNPHSFADPPLPFLPPHPPSPSRSKPSAVSASTSLAPLASAHHTALAEGGGSGSGGSVRFAPRRLLHETLRSSPLVHSWEQHYQSELVLRADEMRASEEQMSDDCFFRRPLCCV
jgi:hypothetical protein